MTNPRPITAPEIRLLARKHAKLLAVLIDTLPCDYDLSYDDAVAVTARTLIDYAPIFCEITSLGTGLSEGDVQRTTWPEVVRLGCATIEATREHWRMAWEHGFLQRILTDELRDYSSFVRGVAR
jgi:hypothetical protein